MFCCIKTIYRRIKIMTNLADNVIALSPKLDAVLGKLDDLIAAVKAVPAGSASDLTPVLDAVADVKAALVGAVVPTVAAATPDAAPPQA